MLNSDSQKAISVTETRIILQGGKSIKTIGPEVKQRNSGTYKTEQEVTFPARIPGGIYSLKGTVTAQGKTSIRETNFRVAKIETEKGYLYTINRVVP